MEIGLGLDPTLGLSDEEHRTLAREARELGYASLWTPAGGERDAFARCAAWQETAGIATGISVLPMSAWRAEDALREARAVAGRAAAFTLGIGSGRERERAIGLVRDALRALRPPLAEAGVPVHLGALGPRMLALAGSDADGAALNWCTPAQVAWSRERIAEGARRAGRDPSSVVVGEYIRVCADEDPAAARIAYAKALLRYALLAPDGDPARGYRAHFARMGFDDALARLEALRDGGADLDALAAASPDELLLGVGYHGSAAGAAAAVRALARGLDIAIVRVVVARSGIEAVRATMRACAGTRAPT